MIAISSFKLKAVATGAACVVVGAAAGIVGASAAPTPKSAKSTKPAAPTLPQGPGRGAFHGRFHGGFAGPRGGLGPAVHATVVELNKAGTGFITVTEDSGTVTSVSGDSLTIKEAVGKVVYRSVTLSIPSSATVTRNFPKAALSSLKSGDRVRVEQSSEGTDVFAIDPSSMPRRGGPDEHPGGWGPGAGGRPGVLPQSGGASAPAPPVPQTGA